MLGGLGMLGGGSFDERACHVARLVAFGMLFQEVGEEKQLQDHKDYEQFDKDNGPQRLAEAHRAETIVIEVKGSVQKTVLLHK